MIKLHIIKKLFFFFSLLLSLFLISCIKEKSNNYADFSSINKKGYFVILHSQTSSCISCKKQTEVIEDYLIKNPNIANKTIYYDVSLDQLDNDPFKNAPYYALQGGLIILYDDNREIGRLLGSSDTLEIVMFLNKIKTYVPTNRLVSNDTGMGPNVKAMQNLEELKSQAAIYTKKTKTAVPLPGDLSDETVNNLKTLNDISDTIDVSNMRFN